MEFYEPYDDGEHLDGQDGKVIGKLRVIQKNKNKAYVSVHGVKIDIYIKGEKDRNRALDGDVVVCELYPQDMWEPTEIKKDTDCLLREELPSEESTSVGNRLWGSSAELLAYSAFSGETVSEAHWLDDQSKSCGKQPTAKVIKLLKPRDRNLVGEILIPSKQRASNKLIVDAQYVSFKPSDSKYFNVILQRIQLPEYFVNNPVAYSSHIFTVDISRSKWGVSSRYAPGENVRSIGEMGDINVETACLLRQNLINHNEIFPDDVIHSLQEYIHGDTFRIPQMEQPDQNNSRSAAERAAFALEMSMADEGHSESVGGATREWQIPAEEILKRRDLRSHRIFTIDPTTAKDLDDALHITKLTDGPADEHTIYELGVHIADVSYFVQPDTPTDIEAQKRLTSVYLVQKVIPMLPPILCEQLCSLNPNVDRLAFSCIWQIRQDGSLVDGSVYYGKTVIRSCAKLDYLTAQRMVDGTISSSPDHASACPALWEESRRPTGGHLEWQVAQDVCYMHLVAHNRRQQRMGNGALVLNQPKLVFSLNGTGNPNSFDTYAIKDSNHLVEEYMLLANYLVARELCRMNGKLAFLRNHVAPKNDALEQAKQVAAGLGVELEIGSSAQLQGSLEHMKRTASASTCAVVMHTVLCCQQLATYIVGFTRSSEAWSHYALAIPFYTHFTSPIRRYADVMVHRMLEWGINDLAACRNADEDLLEASAKIAAECNERKEGARQAQMKSDELFLAVYLKGNPINVQGLVVSLKPKIINVSLPSLGLSCGLFVDDMLDVSNVFSETEQRMVLTRPRTASTSSKVTSSTSKGKGASKGSSGKTTGKERIPVYLPNTLLFEKLELSVGSTVTVQVSASATAPISIVYALVGTAI